MRIILLCGSLEAGRDGVGDYVRLLAIELLQQGHEVGAVALSDQYILHKALITQEPDASNLPVLRLPSTWSAQRRFTRAENWVNNFNPEWLSLHFVAFSFHSKGLPFSLGDQLARLGKGRRWHFMFHELWTGMDKDSSFKQLLLGWIQKQVIRRLLKTVKPRIIHTQTKLYQIYLIQMGFKVQHLPLFANISANTTYIKSRPTQGQDEVQKSAASFVVFGTIQHGSLIKQFAKDARIYSDAKNINLSLTIIGRSGGELAQFAAAWQLEGLPLIVLGEQPTHYVSETLQCATVGLSTNPTVLAEKSGTIAAMREHCLPVLCISRPWHPRKQFYIEPIQGITEYHVGHLDTYLAQVQKIPCSTNVSTITTMLIDSLLACS